MNKSKTNDYQNKIITIPNLLSFLRLCMIPLIVWQYTIRHHYARTAVLLLLSGITDVLDGFIARRFHMVSDFGKAFDPIADKLTQLSIMLCLITHFPFMGVAFVIMLLKELFLGIIGLIAIRKTTIVPSAKWHGKTCTVLLYLIMTVHILWPSIPKEISDASIIVLIITMLISATLYTISGTRSILHARHNAKHASLQ